MKLERRDGFFNRNKSRLIIGSIVTVCIILGLAFLGYRWLYSGWEKPVQSSSELVLFVIKEGDTVEEVATHLEKEKIVQKSSVFMDQAKTMSFSSPIVGEFALDKSWSNEKIISTLSSQDSVLEGHLNIMFPPGYWAKDVAHKLANLTYLNEKDILAQWSDQSYVKSLQADYPFLTNDIFKEGSKVYLEGYLYPETYNFLTETTIDEATRIILNQTKVIYQKYKENFEKSTYSIHQLFTLASIVNFEAAKLEDMKEVSQVFYNRLNVQMKLQSSVTVCYALYDFKSWKDCESNADIVSPYNTYLHNGLPPGPVMNPVDDAFNAIFNPTKTDALYFVADVKTGEMFFTKDYEEHLENVKKHVDIYR